MERKRGELLLEGVSAVGHSKEKERGRVETNEPRKETKETLSVLCRQKGAKWVVIVFNTDKDSARVGGGIVYLMWVLDTPHLFSYKTGHVTFSLD